MYICTCVSMSMSIFKYTLSYYCTIYNILLYLLFKNHLCLSYLFYINKLIHLKNNIIFLVSCWYYKNCCDNICVCKAFCIVMNALMGYSCECIYNIYFWKWNCSVKEHWWILFAKLFFIKVLLFYNSTNSNTYLSYFFILVS